MTQQAHLVTCRSRPFAVQPLILVRGNLPWRRRCPLPMGSVDDLDVFRPGSLLALGDVELDLLPFPRLRQPPAIALKCTNASGPPSTAMKP